MDELFKRLVAEHMTTRKISVTPSSYDKEKRSVTVVASTETPVQVFDWERWEIVSEVLLTKGFQLRSGEQAPLLDSHSRWSVEDVLGSARNWTRGDGVLQADIHFASTEDSVAAETKMREGHLTDVSVGYQPVESVFVPKGQRQNIEGKDYEGPVRVTTKWTVHELSLVPIGADQFAKARSAAKSEDERIAAIVNQRIEEEIVKRNITSPEGSVQIMEPVALTEEQRAKLEVERKTGIEGIAAEFKTRIKGGEKVMDELATSAVRLGIDLDTFRGTVFSRINDGQPLQQPAAKIGMNEEETKRFSIARIIQHAMEPSKFDIGFEKECAQELGKRGITSQQGGIVIPWDVQVAPRAELAPYMQQRADQTTSATYGGNLIGTDYQAASFIELLRAKELGPQLGVMYMTGLNQNVAVPRQSAGGTWYWVSEQGNYTQSDNTFGQLTLAPKMGGAWVKFSRKLATQATPAIEGLVTNDLTLVAALGCDKALFHGTGSTQPTGIVSTSGVGSVSGAALGWEGAVEFETDISGANGEIGSINTVMHPTVRGALKTREISSGYPKFVVENNEMNGYPVKVSTQITNGYIIAGVFSQAIIADFGVMEILVDPYGNVTGDVKVTVFRQIDVGIRQPAAFSVCSDFS